MRGSPGGILAIGIGVFLLALAWTGKIGDVLGVLKSPSLPSVPTPNIPTPTPPPQKKEGESCGPDDSCEAGLTCHVSDPNSRTGTCIKPTGGTGKCDGPTERKIILRTDNAEHCVTTDRLAAPDGPADQNHGCRAGWIPGIIPGSGQNVCVHPTGTAGAAVREPIAQSWSFGDVPLATGYMGRLYQPNVGSAT